MKNPGGFRRIRFQLRELSPRSTSHSDDSFYFFRPHIKGTESNLPKSHHLWLLDQSGYHIRDQKTDPVKSPKTERKRSENRVTERVNLYKSSKHFLCEQTPFLIPCSTPQCVPTVEHGYREILSPTKERTRNMELGTLRERNRVSSKLTLDKHSPPAKIRNPDGRFSN